jgi:ComF family protein
MNLLDTFLGLAAPDCCVGCGKEESPLCRECTDVLNVYKAPICCLCGRASKGFKVCPKCITSTTPQHIWVATEYIGVAKILVKEFKFEYVRRAAKNISEQIDAQLPYFAEEPLLTWVPTAPAHIRERSFDHALLLTKELAKLRNWRYVPLLSRQSVTQQHGAKRADRLMQIKGAFRVKNSDYIAKKHILLIDDIVTTGATISECAKMLKKAGALQVDAAVFARTPKL